MNFLLGFCPFQAPTSPPFALACLKAALQQARPNLVVQTVDWNLEFFRRWLLGEPPHVCDYHPSHLLGRVCPNLLVDREQGRKVWDGLTTLPMRPQDVKRYITATKLLDEIYRTLAGFFEELLRPFVEGRTQLLTDTIDRVFSAELAFLESKRPDVLGFSILTEQNLLYSLALARVVKQRFDTRIVLGGAMMSHLDPVEILFAFPWIDYVFSGEAEGSLVRFADVMGGGTGAISEVGGVAYRDAAGTPVCCAPSKPPNLDHLPFADFSDFPLRDYLAPEPVLPLMSCRGCYWGKCTFCSHTLPFAPGVRARGAERIVDEMEHQKQRCGVSHFLFVDEAMSPKTLRQVSEEIGRRGLDVSWGAEGIRAERQFDEALLATAYRAGLRWVYVGVESAVQRLLDRIEKGIDVVTIERFVVACRKTGIVPQLSFIIGIPGTTEHDLAEEIRFMHRYPVDASSFVLLLGSPMQRCPDAFGIRIEDREALFETPHGLVHSPRFYFTSPEGLSPPAADRIVAASGHESRRPRMRPHLGEVHATVLASTGFFDSEARPPEPPPAALRVRGQLESDGSDPRAALHRAGCLEALADFEGALGVVQQALSGAETGCNNRRKLLVHLAALSNRTGRPQWAGWALGELDEGRATDATVEAEFVYSSYQAGDHAGVVKHAEALLSTGHEFEGIHYVLARGYEKLGYLEKALGSLRTAEARDWFDHGINVAQARVLEKLNRRDEAGEARAKAERKARFLDKPYPDPHLVPG